MIAEPPFAKAMLAEAARLRAAAEAAFLPAVRKIISCHFSVAKSAESVVRTIGMSAQGMRLRASMDRLLRWSWPLRRNRPHRCFRCMTSRWPSAATCTRTASGNGRPIMALRLLTGEVSSMRGA